MSATQSPGLSAMASALLGSPPILQGGRVSGCSGAIVQAAGLDRMVGIGDTCWIERPPSGAGTSASTSNGTGRFDRDRAILAEVVGLDRSAARLLPYADVTGVGLGARVLVDRGLTSVRPDRRWLGRIIDSLGRPMDGLGALPAGPDARPIQAQAVAAGERGLLGSRLDLGVRAMDLFTPCCAGQRLGIFAGSGVGKSSVLSMIAKRSDADVLVIGLIGERGRELNEFVHHTLGKEGLARSVLVVATSDQPAMMRRRAAYLTLTVAEHLRDQGLRVLCLLDSVTRFAMALREIYLAAGEPPTSKGYPPSVFTELPRLLERAGPGAGKGSITGLFSVLVEGDDTNEPIADTVRGILDGHVVLSRRIAEAGRYPAVDVLKSLSRSAPACYAPEERLLVGEARRLMATYAEMEELVQIGAYRPGGNPLLDRAISLRPALEELLSQPLDEQPATRSPFEALAAILAGGPPAVTR